MQLFTVFGTNLMFLNKKVIILIAVKAVEILQQNFKSLFMSILLFLETYRLDTKMIPII